MCLKFLIALSCLCTAVLARHYESKYFNTTAHALNVYGHSYYNPMSGVPLEGIIEDTERLPFSTPKISFRGLPCACLEDGCGCCAGLNISAINFDRRYCANFTFDPSQMMLDLKVLMNNDQIFQTSLSARNPPPVCVPLPYIPVVDFCLRFYDLSLQNNTNLRTCIDFETRLAHSPLLVMHFNCVRVGTDGISWSRPANISSTSNDTQSSFSPNGLSASSTNNQQTTEVYDVVNFENADELPNDGYPVNSTTLSPEDEDKIGEHRFRVQARVNV